VRQHHSSDSRGRNQFSPRKTGFGRQRRRQFILWEVQPA
jgi:hypothetical protein